jgi:hypothetical protein
MAEKHFSIAAQDENCDQRLREMNATLMACANGDLELARTKLTQLVEKDAENFVAINNLAVVALSEGKVSEVRIGT